MSLTPAPSEASRETSAGELIHAARHGCARSLGELAQRYRRYLLMVANESLSPVLRAKVGASDLVQETLLHFQEKFPRFDGTSEEELLTWLRRILYYRALQVARRFGGTQARDVRRELSLSELALAGGTPGVIDEAPTPFTTLLAKEQVHRLQSALAFLTEDSRHIIQLRNLERLSFEEIGNQLGCSTDAARKRWVRAVAQLRVHLHGDE
jgi:RNA polymerase sigma-70 factor (ECF subfamily)